MKNEKKLIFKNEDRKNRFSLTLLFSIIIFCVLVLAIMITVLILLLLNALNIMTQENMKDISAIPFFLLLSAISLVIGFLISILILKIPLKPINQLINKTKRLASGDFKARLKFSGKLYVFPAFKEIEESFNKMADELENTEMLRSDFINNFSHEFKTPIVSISGFAKLLKHGDLTKEEQKEYISIIEEESNRLSYITNNVLTLTRVENKSILTNVSSFNLSEQIRSCLLMLENKWSEKNIELILDFDEVNITANEDMLKEVWINLLDNAIKFTTCNGIVKIEIKPQENKCEISIINSGSEIKKEHIPKIFNKFYQCDESHSEKGNGLGLSIVKQITELHHGYIEVSSENNFTEFKVIIPQNY